MSSTTHHTFMILTLRRLQKGDIVHNEYFLDAYGTGFVVQQEDTPHGGHPYWEDLSRTTTAEDLEALGYEIKPDPEKTDSLGQAKEVDTNIRVMPASFELGDFVQPAKEGSLGKPYVYESTLKDYSTVETPFDILYLEGCGNAPLEERSAEIVDLFHHEYGELGGDCISPEDIQEIAQKMVGMIEARKAEYDKAVPSSLDGLSKLIWTSAPPSEVTIQAFGIYAVTYSSSYSYEYGPDNDVESCLHGPIQAGDLFQVAFDLLKAPS